MSQIRNEGGERECVCGEGRKGVFIHLHCQQFYEGDMCTILYR